MAELRLSLAALPAEAEAPRRAAPRAETAGLGATQQLGATAAFAAQPAAGALALTRNDWQKATASNPFYAELGLLSQLMEPRVSAKHGKVSLPAPAALGASPGRKRQAVPPLSESEVALGEVQSLPGYGKLLLGQSSTGHAGLKEMQISRKHRHEQAIEVYQKKVVQHEVELEARTGQVRSCVHRRETTAMPLAPRHVRKCYLTASADSVSVPSWDRWQEDLSN